MQKISVTHEYALPVERVYPYLAEHEHLGPLFAPIRVERLNDGVSSRNGVGSARTLSFWGAGKFVETVIEAVENELIVYRITKGSPLKDHRGEMRFSPTATGGTRLQYDIVFGSKLPGLDRLLKPALERTLRKGLPTVETAA